MFFHYLYRISELRAELDLRSDKETALKEETRRQEVTIMELETSLSHLKGDIDERQLEVRRENMCSEKEEK